MPELFSSLCMAATLTLISGQNWGILVTEHNLWGCDSFLAVLQSTEAPTQESPVSVFP